MLRIYWVAAQLVASRVVFSSTELARQGRRFPRDVRNGSFHNTSLLSITGSTVWSTAGKGTCLPWQHIALSSLICIESKSCNVSIQNVWIPKNFTVQILKLLVLLADVLAIKISRKKLQFATHLPGNKTVFVADMSVPIFLRKITIKVHIHHRPVALYWKPYIQHS
jgi:hypothetical protein